VWWGGPAQNEVDHPLRAVNRATRRAWHAHPISLPFHVYNTLNQATPKNASQLPLDHRARLSVVPLARDHTHTSLTFWLDRRVRVRARVR